jgi:hypothetical protein
MAQSIGELTSPPLSGGSPRKGARTREAREQRLAAGGPQGSPDPYLVQCGLL